MRIYIEGQLQTRKWQDNAGIEKYTTEIVLQNFRGELVLLDRVENNQGIGITLNLHLKLFFNSIYNRLKSFFIAHG